MEGLDGVNGLCNQKKRIYHLANLINVLPLNPFQFLVFFFYSNLAGERKRDVSCLFRYGGRQNTMAKQKLIFIKVGISKAMTHRFYRTRLFSEKLFVVFNVSKLLIGVGGDRLVRNTICGVGCRCTVSPLYIAQACMFLLSFFPGRIARD